MSDLSIPGVNDKYNTQKIIDALMAVKKEPLTRREKELATQTQKRAAWLDMSRKLSTLRDTSRTLFGFQNPFNDRIAGSSDSAVLTATATRQAAEETKSIVVAQVATADRFLSRPLARDFTVEAGQYTFAVGDKTVSLAWKGGSLKAFADALSAKGAGVLAASVVNDSTTTQVLLVEGKLTGSRSRLVFSDKAVDLGVASGMLARSATGTRPVALTTAAVAPWAAPLASSAFLVRDGALSVSPGTELRIPLSPPATLSKNVVLEMQVRVRRLPEPGTETPKPPPGPSIPATGGIDFQGIHVEGAPSEAPLPAWEPPKPPENVTDLGALFIESGGSAFALPAVPDTTEWQTVQVPVGELASTMDSLAVRNRNTWRVIEVRDVKLYDRTQRGDHVPANALSEAGDAKITMDGIEVTRSTNTVDDLIPGVTLSLKKPSAQPVSLSITHDVQGIVKQVETLVGAYNGIVTDIDILTRKDPAIISDATYLTDEEKKKAEANLGLFAGDLSLQQLKSSMQNLMMNAYPTSLGRDLSLLAQLGVSTDTRAPGSATIDKTRLRGYLEVDEAKLTAAVEQKAEAVKELFGNDTTGDLVVDAGVAFSLEALLRPYVATGGILPSRVTTLDGQIKDSTRWIADYKLTLADYEAELKKKYAQMGSALNALEQNSTAIDNFNKQNSSGQ